MRGLWKIDANDISSSFIIVFQGRKKMKKQKEARRIRVTIDDVNKFVAWTFDEEWNEWAVPHFEKNEADKVATAHNCKYNPDNDSYEFEQAGEVEEFEGLEIKTFEGPKKVYPIGAGSWVWDEVEQTEN
jgi:hypothetical protein